MAVGCGAKFAKVMLIVFNIIFLCTGIILIALGIWLLVTLAQSWGPSAIFQLATGSYLYRNAAILLISMGCLILFVTILGLIAAIRESVILLSIYLVFLFIIFAGEIAGGVVAIVYKDRIITQAYKVLSDSLNPNLYYPWYRNGSTTCSSFNRDKLVPSLWDMVQVKLDCCGITTGYDGYASWNQTTLNPCNATTQRWPTYTNLTQKPLSCCQSYPNLTDFDTDNQNPSYFDCSKPRESGCDVKIQYWIIKFSPVLIGIGIGFGMLEMFGVIFVVCLCMNTDKSFKRF